MIRRERAIEGVGVNETNTRWLKAEMHSHCSLDPVDYAICKHSPEELIDEAARQRFDVLAITCHDLDVWSRALSEYAASKGIILIPAMEVTTEVSRHTLVYNFQAGAENLNTLVKIRSQLRPDNLVVAAHPYFPGNRCLRGLVEPNIDLFDAIESSGFYTRAIDFNRRARQVARRHGKAMIGNGDIHFLWQLGRTFTWIYSEPSVIPILRAVKAGNVRVESAPLSEVEAARWWFTALWRKVFPVNPVPRGRDLVAARSNR
jgi:predicted metal-dependent phosphoesterase TrpH